MNRVNPIRNCFVGAPNFVIQNRKKMKISDFLILIFWIGLEALVKVAVRSLLIFIHLIPFQVSKLSLFETHVSINQSLMNKSLNHALLPPQAFDDKKEFSHCLPPFPPRQPVLRYFSVFQ
jgi:hypothetical protein